MPKKKMVREGQEIPQEALAARPNLPTDAQGRPIGPDGQPLRLRRKKIKKKGGLGFLIPVVGLLIGAVLVAWPLIDDWIRQQDYNGVINQAESVSSYDTPEYREMWEQALLYNRMMANALTENDDPSTIKPYEEQLASNAAGLMSWIEIPALSAKLPIYHYATEQSLMSGVGHIDTTSLPTGAADTNSPMKCVISGHSGMANERMFDDIDSLKPGDRMTLHTIGHESYYEVVYSEVVEPTELEKLKIEPGDDELVLVTCTPYGINTHRLLVHAHETDIPPEELSPVQAVANYLTKGRNLGYFLGFLGLFLLAILILTLGLIRAARRRKARKFHEEGKRNAGLAAGDEPVQPSATSSVPAILGQTPPIGPDGKPMRLVRKKKVKKGRKGRKKAAASKKQDMPQSSQSGQIPVRSQSGPMPQQAGMTGAMSPVQPVSTGRMPAMPQQAAQAEKTGAMRPMSTSSIPVQPAQPMRTGSLPAMPQQKPVQAAQPAQTSPMPRPSKQVVMSQVARQINYHTGGPSHRNFAGENENEAPERPTR